MNISQGGNNRTTVVNSQVDDNRPPVSRTSEQLLEQDVACLELAILAAVRGFELRTGRRIEGIRVHTRTESLNEYKQFDPYFAKYTDHVTVRLKDPADDDRWRQEATEKAAAEKEAYEQEKRVAAERVRLAAAFSFASAAATADETTREEEPNGD